MRSQTDGYAYVPPAAIADDRAIMTDADECRHLIRVVRKRRGDRVTFVDGAGWVYDGEIERVEPGAVLLHPIVRRRDETEPRVRIGLAPALIKGNRLDFVVEKATELGVDRIIPMRTARTVVDHDAAGGEARRARWQRLALSAMKQSLRSWLPPVAPVTGFADVIASASQYDLALIAWEGETDRGIASVLAERPRPNRVLLLIGPEGGFDEAEVADASRAQVYPVSLGRRRLRAETANLVALTVLMAALE